MLKQIVLFDLRHQIIDIGLYPLVGKCLIYRLLCSDWLQSTDKFAGACGELSRLPVELNTDNLRLRINIRECAEQFEGVQYHFFTGQIIYKECG